MPERSSEKYLQSSTAAAATAGHGLPVVFGIVIPVLEELLGYRPVHVLHALLARDVLLDVVVHPVPTPVVAEHETARRQGAHHTRDLDEGLVLLVSGVQEYHGRQRDLQGTTKDF